MRSAAAVLASFLPVLLAGCFTFGPGRSITWVDRRSLFQVPVGADIVVMDVALIERPVGDRYINQDLWEAADEQVVKAEHRIALADNGFRVAQVDGIIPSGLQSLLTSDRSCVNPYRVHVHDGNVTTVKLGTELSQFRCTIPNGIEQHELSLEHALSTLVIKPMLTRDGKTRLQFTPRIQHGETAMVPEPATDPSGVHSWTLREKRPAESFDQLNWEVVLAPSAYVIIGARYDAPGTLAHSSLIRRDMDHASQYLLVIRTGRPMEGIESASNLVELEEDTAGTPTAAYQAASTMIQVENK